MSRDLRLEIAERPVAQRLGLPERRAVRRRQLASGERPGLNPRDRLVVEGLLLCLTHYQVVADNLATLYGAVDDGRSRSRFRGS